METPPIQPPPTPLEEALAKAEQDAIRKSIPTYEELVAEAEASMDADIKRAASEERKRKLEKKETTVLTQNVDATLGTTIKDHLDEALAFADVPEEVQLRLLAPIVKEVREDLSPEEGYDVIARMEEVTGNLEMAEQLRKFYGTVDQGVLHTAVTQLVARLETLHEAATGTRKAKLEKVIAAIREADPHREDRQDQDKRAA